MTSSKTSLNKQQREAVDNINGPLLVLAGAGTGKTHTVTMRIARLLDKGYAPEEILAVTFTNKAAGEMKERIKRLVGRKHNIATMIVSTFHSLCVRILRRDAAALGYGSDFSICDQGEQLGLVHKAAKFVRGDVGLKPEEILYEIGKLKNQGMGHAEFSRRAVDEWERVLASVYRRYQDSLKSIQAFR